MTTLTTKEKRKAIWYAFSNESNKGLLQVLLAVVIGSISLMLWVGLSVWVGLIVTMLSLTGMWLLIVTAYRDWALADSKYKYALLKNWVRSAKSADEKNARELMMNSTDANSLLAKAGIEYQGPALNIDGTMMTSSGLDTNGNPFGVISEMAPVFNEALDNFSFPDSAYSSPIGMD